MPDLCGWRVAYLPPGEGASLRRHGWRVGLGRAPRLGVPILNVGVITHSH
jgi:hypothetical protein